MRCPRDGTELTARIYEANIEIDECPACKGTFLDQGELEGIQSAIEKDCPKCGASMERRRYGLGSQTVIDACPQGHGLWLDRGELEELERFYERSQDEVQIPLMWRIWAAVRGSVAKKK